MSLSTVLWVAIPAVIIIVGFAIWLTTQSRNDDNYDDWWL